MPQKLLIGYDGSENGDDALALGAILAECLAASPIVAAVLPHLEHLLCSDQLRPAVERDAAPILDAARERLGELDETRAIVDGSPARALHELAEAMHPAVVVIGSAHRGRIGRILLGSVGSALLSGAPCAIAVAPQGYASRERRSMLRLCVAVDGSDESWPALAAATGLAARLHASLTLLGVVEPIRFSHGGEYPAIDPTSYEHAAEQAFERAMDRVPADLPATRQLMKGDAPALIADAASDYDLLILGSRGYGPVRRALLGSVSAKLMEISPAPVLILPRRRGRSARRLLGSLGPAQLIVGVGGSEPPRGGRQLDRPSRRHSEHPRHVGADPPLRKLDLDLRDALAAGDLAGRPQRREHLEHLLVRGEQHRHEAPDARRARPVGE